MNGQKRLFLTCLSSGKKRTFFIIWIFFFFNNRFTQFKGGTKGAELCWRMHFSVVPPRKFYFTCPTNVCGLTFTVKLNRVLNITA